MVTLCETELLDKRNLHSCPGNDGASHQEYVQHLHRAWSPTGKDLALGGTKGKCRCATPPQGELSTAERKFTPRLTERRKRGRLSLGGYKHERTKTKLSDRTDRERSRRTPESRAGTYHRTKPGDASPHRP